jgi:N-carbamoyl-L-amino-acid hydrolase
MILQFPDADVAVLEPLRGGAAGDRAAHDKRGPCKVECVNLSRTMPTVMDDRFLDAIEESAAPCARQARAHAVGRRPRRADPRAEAAAAMMFVPSIGGISHHFTENTATPTSCSAARSSPTRRRRS